jgi:hypothetical protein
MRRAWLLIIQHRDPDRRTAIFETISRCVGEAAPENSRLMSELLK